MGKRFGFFIPNQNHDNYSIYKGEIDRAGTHNTPSDVNPEMSVYSVDAMPQNKEDALSYCEIIADNVEDDMKNAIDADRSTVVITAASDDAIGMSENDYHVYQLKNSGGLYNDEKTRGSFIFTKTDPRLDSAADYRDFYGKARLPVADFIQELYFKRSDQQTNVDPSLISWIRHTTDGENIYAIAVVRDEDNADDTRLISYKYNMYDKSYCRMGDVDTRLIYSLWDASDVYDSTFMNYAMPPFTPDIIYVPELDKFIAAAIVVDASMNNVLKLRVYESKDKCLTWQKIHELSQDNFFQFIEDNLPIRQVRLRLASSGLDVLLVWAYRGFDNQGGMYYMRSLDGGSSWFSNKDNMTYAFRIHNDGYQNASDYDAIDVSSNFGLTYGDGRYVIMRRGDVDTATYYNKRMLILYADATINGQLNWNNYYIDGNYYGLDYDANRKVDDAGRYAIEWHPSDDREFMDEVELAYDDVHNFGYAVFKMHNTSDNGARGPDYYTVLIRWKIMPRNMWTTFPDWVATGISFYGNGKDIILAEPPNYPNAIYLPSPYRSSTTYNTDHLNAFSLVIYRSQLLLAACSDADTVEYPIQFGFRFWSNYPITYSMAAQFVPALGDPRYQGWRRNNSGSTVVTLNRGDDYIRFDPNDAPTSNEYTRYYAYSSNSYYYNGSLGRHENVIRFVFRATQLPNSGRIRIMRAYGRYYSTTLNRWRRFNWLIDLYSTYIRFRTGTTAYSHTYNDSDFDGNTWYEYRLVRAGEHIAIYKRKLNTVGSKPVEDWMLLFTHDQDAPDYGTYSSDRVYWGIYIATSGGDYSNVLIDFKYVESSIIFRDIYPNSKNYLLEEPREPDFTLNELGILRSSMTNFSMDNPQNTESYLQSLVGEYLSGKPIWFGTNWHVLGASPMSQYAMYWLNFKERINKKILTGYLIAYKNSGYDGEWVVADDSAYAPDIQEPMGAVFDGVDDYINLKTSDAMKKYLSKAFTFNVWIKSSSSTSSIPLLSQYDYSTNTGFRIEYYKGLDALALVADTSGYTSDAEYSVNTIDYDMFTVCVDNENGKVLFYKNAQLISEHSIMAYTYADVDVLLGATNDLGRFYDGYMIKPAIFDKILTPKEINTLWMETKYGPLVPSDLFASWSGIRPALYKYWKLESKYYGGQPDNVLDSIIGTRYYSDISGRPGMVSGGGTSTLPSDVELIIKNEIDNNDEFIEANAIYIDDTNATDVLISATNYSLGAAGSFTQLKSANFAEYDMIEQYEIDIYDGDDGIINGILTVTDNRWRINQFVGRRAIIIQSEDSIYDSSANPAQNRIVKITNMYNNKIIFDDMSLNISSGVNIKVRILTNRILIKLDTLRKFRYWRILLNNNVSNGEKIYVGNIRLGTYMEIEDVKSNQQTRMLPAISQLSNKQDIIKYGDNIKQTFKLDFIFNSVNTTIPDYDFDKLVYTLQNSMNILEPVYLVTQINDELGYTSHVYPCMVKDDVRVNVKPAIGIKEMSVTLEEL